MTSFLNSQQGQRITNTTCITFKINTIHRESTSHNRIIFIRNIKKKGGKYFFLKEKKINEWDLCCKKEQRHDFLKGKRKQNLTLK